MSKIVLSLRIVLFLSVVLISELTHAAADAFIKFESPTGAPEIKGDSRIKGMEAFTAVSSVSFGIENTLNIGSATGGAGAGKAKFNEISLDVDAGLSTQLFMVSALGGHYGKVTLNFTKVGSSKPGAIVTYFIVEMSMVAVKSVEFTSSGDEGVRSKVVLQCGGIKLKYFKVSPTTGEMDTKPIEASWDIISNSQGK